MMTRNAAVIKLRQAIGTSRNYISCTPRATNQAMSRFVWLIAIASRSECCWHHGHVDHTKHVNAHTRAYGISTVVGGTWINSSP